MDLKGSPAEKKKEKKKSTIFHGTISFFDICAENANKNKISGYCNSSYSEVNQVPQLKGQTTMSFHMV